MIYADSDYQQYVQVLKDELIPAMGCTEPISIALAAAKARETLGHLPDRLIVEVSGNIIKNVKSVVVPHTGGLRGIKAAAAAGIIVGDPSRQLEVLSRVTQEQIAEIGKYLNSVPIEVKHKETPYIFDIMMTAYYGKESAYVRIVEHHTNIVSVRHNDIPLLSEELPPEHTAPPDHAGLSVEKIIEFADCVHIEDIQDILDRQINYNMAIAQEGLLGNYGANIGKTLLAGHENDVNYKMRAYAAAASDARMNGCELPVIINSGSGNQGITTSVPVIVYAQEMQMSHTLLLRALCVSNLITAPLKTGIGRLSAYCGAVSAGCGAAAGIAYLQGGKYDTIAHTVVNALAMDSGIVCDGAKASCAAKIASSVDAGLLGLMMYQHGNQFFGGDGLIKKGVENTISNIGRLARNGMQQTDKEIIRIMLEN